MDQEERGDGEEILRLPAARDSEPVAHVGDGLGVVERSEMPAERDPLVQLGERGIEDERPQLGLAHEHEAEKLLRARLQVRQEAQLLQHVDRDRLRLVEDDDGEPTGGPLAEEMLVERIHDVDLTVARGRDAEVARDALEQLLRGQGRVEDVRRGDLGTEAVEEGAQERRLPGADVARDADEPAGLHQTRLQMGERLGVLRREVEVARVGCQPKRRIREPEERLVHPTASPASGLYQRGAISNFSRRPARGREPAAPRGR